MGRPPNHPAPVIVVRIDGRLITWCDGKFAGDPVLTAYAREAARRGDEYTLAFAPVRCEAETPLGAVASMCARRPGRARILRAPAEVSEWFLAHRLYCSTLPA